MMRLLHTLIAGFCLLLVVPSCQVSKLPEPAYQKSYDVWRNQRLQSLKAPQSWTSLTGLFWLEEGSTAFGSDTENDIVLPTAEQPILGTWELTDSLISLAPYKGVHIQCHQSAYHSRLVATDEDPDPDIFTHGSLIWTVIVRNDRHAMRVWDTAHLARLQLDTIASYPLTQDWNLPARYAPGDSVRIVVFDDVLGLKRPYPVIGSLHMEYQDQPFELLALEGGPDDLFLIFRDHTTGDATYGGGRYLYCPRPDSTGMTMVDFNRAFNPPCAFTEFATCLLPPRENSIPLEVTAGEKAVNVH